MLTPYMKTYYPNDIESKEEYLEKRLDGKLRRWVRHVGPYLAHADDLDIHVVFYERLLLDFTSELNRLLDYLGISLDERECRAIEDAVTFQSMKDENPEHVQKGKAGKWREQMTPAQKRRSVAVAGPLMKKLGYPLQNTRGQVRPSVPDQMTPEEADDMIDHAEHPFFRDKLRKRVRQVYQTIFR
jgi:aryl sulfotransferase